MLYLTPLLVTTLCDYPEELSIQLQLVEAMHRIIHLPLSCWSDALTADDAQEQAQEVSMVHGCMAERASSRSPRAAARSDLLRVWLAL